jgi:hypothetical protein
MVRTGRPRKEPTQNTRIRRTDNTRVIDLAAKAGLSVPDYLHTIIPMDEDNQNGGFSK